MKINGFDKKAFIRVILCSVYAEVMMERDNLAS